MTDIWIRNDSSASEVHIFIDSAEVKVKSGTEVERTVSPGLHALLWWAKGKKDETVKVTVRTSTRYVARVNRVIKDAKRIADGTTFVG